MFLCFATFGALKAASALLLVFPHRTMVIRVVMHALSLAFSLPHTHTHTHAHTHTHTHIPLSLCWGTIKTVSNAATYSSAHTLNCVNVWVHIIFQGCHSLRLFSPVFNYWTPWHCRPRMHDIPVPVRMCVCVCVCLCVFSHRCLRVWTKPEKQRLRMK